MKPARSAGVLVSVILVCFLLGAIALNLSLPAKAQSQPNFENISKNYLGNTSPSYWDLPDFKLPYASGQGIRWTGGPHAYGEGGLGATIPSGQGSGLDFSNGTNFEVLAMASGNVVDVSCDLVDFGFGCQVAIQHDVGGTVIVYAHLEEDSIIQIKNRFQYYQQRGESYWVPQGAVLAKAGNSGKQSNIHLHIELRTGEKNANGWVCHRRCLSGNLGGDPLGWDQLLELHAGLDTWSISGYCVPDPDHECLNIFNYDGSAFRLPYNTTFKILHKGEFRYQDYGKSELNEPDMVRVGEFFSCKYPEDTTKDCELPENQNNPNKLTQFARDGGKGALLSLQNDIEGKELAFLGNVGDLVNAQDSFNDAGELISSNVPIYIFGEESTPTPYATNPPTTTDGIQLCREQNYEVPCQTYIFTTNDNCINLAQTGMDNFSKSVKFLGNYIGNYDVIMFGDNYCNVYAARYGSDAPNLGGLNNQISSIKIEQLQPADCSTASDGVTLYENAGYQGHCHTFTPGSYGDLSQFGLDQNITSIKNPGNSFAVHLNDGLNFSGQPGHFDADVYDLGPNGWSDRARSVQIERHIPTSCNPTSNGAVLYVDTNYGSGCISVPPDIPDLSAYAMDHALDSLRFFGSYQNASQVLIYRQVNYVDLCGTYWQDQSDLRECAGKAVSVKVLPYTSPTSIPTQPGDKYTGNLALLAYRDRAGSDAVVDGSLIQEWIGGHGSSIGFSWSQAVNIHHIIVWDRAQSSIDNNQINSINIGFSDGTSLLNVNMTSGGPRCADITFPEKNVNWINVIPADASGNNGFREVEIWATTGDQYSNNSCVMKYNLTAAGGGLQPPLVTATPAISPTPNPANTPLPYDELFGDGSDGDVNVADIKYIDEVKSPIMGDILIGQDSLNVVSVAGFHLNDEVLLFQVQGTDAGNYEFGHIASINGNTITLKRPLAHAYFSSGSNHAQIIRVPQYNNLTIASGATISASAWNGTTGGVLAFRVFGTLNLAGNISANYLGFRGAPRNNGVSGAQGEGENGMGSIGCSPNSMGAGGGGSNGYGNPPGGGGGGYSTAGQYGKPGIGNGGACVGAGGNQNGNPELSRGFFGGGGGSGGAKTNDGAAYFGGGGGNGGGAILIFARTISGTGNITAEGQNGYLGGGGGTGSNGGGGAGGSIFIASQTISAGTISAQKGMGAQYAPDHVQNGGNGADGRIRIEYGYSFYANTIPQANKSQSLYLANTPTPTATYTATATPTSTPTLTPTSTLTPTATPTETCVATSGAWLGEFWNNETFSGEPIRCRYYDDVNFEWYSGSPLQGIASDNFATRWTRYIDFSNARYSFQVFHDDGVRLYIDNKLVINNWCDNCRTSDNANVVISSGVHKIKLELREVSGWSSLRFSWSKSVNVSGSPDTTGVFRPSNGLLYLKNSNTTGFADIAINYGTGGDYPVAGDWDGNGTDTIGIYRNGTFYLRNSNTIGFADLVFPFGTPGDQPIAGDWNGDGIDTIGVYRPSTGQFLLRNSNTAGAADMNFYLGNVGDVGIAGDWNGDGIDTTGVFRPSNGVIFLKNTNSTGFADIALNYGLPGDQPVTGDWNNDGIDTIGVYRNGQFLLRNSNTIGFADIVFALGNPGDMPIAGDWDGLP